MKQWKFPLHVPERGGGGRFKDVVVLNTQQHYTSVGSQCPGLKRLPRVGWQMKDFLKCQVEDGMSFWIPELMVIYEFVYYLYKQLALRVVGFHFQWGNFKLWNPEMCIYTERHDCRNTHTHSPLKVPSQLSGFPSCFTRPQSTSVLLIAWPTPFFSNASWLMTVDVTCCLLGRG